MKVKYFNNENILKQEPIGIVPQDTVLFNDTIYIIKYGNPEATYDEIINAAKIAVFMT